MDWKDGRTYVISEQDTQAWAVQGRDLIAEADEIARVCHAAGRPDLAAFPEGVAARTRTRMRETSEAVGHLPAWKRAVRFLRSVRL